METCSAKSEDLDRLVYSSPSWNTLFSLVKVFSKWNCVHVTLGYFFKKTWGSLVEMSKPHKFLQYLRKN